MKKYLAAFSWFIFTLFLLLPNISFAQQWIQDLEAQHIGTRDLDVSGNVAIKGKISHTPDVASYANLSATNIISAWDKAFIIINGTGTIDMSSTPTISTAAALNGQELLIMGGSNPVTFKDEGTLTGSALELGATKRSIGSGDWLKLVFYAGKWYEIALLSAGQYLPGDAAGTALALLTPKRVGALMVNSTTNRLVISSGITVGSWVLVATPTLAGY